MQKTTFVLLFFSICLGCSSKSGTLSPTEKLSYRTIAYDRLSEQEKESIISDWQDAEVRQGIYQYNNSHIIFFVDSKTKLHFLLDDSDFILYPAQPLIAVIFNTVDDALLGPIVIIIEPKSKTPIGFVGRL